MRSVHFSIKSQITRRPHFAYHVHFCNKWEISVFISCDAGQITRTSCFRLQRSCNQNLGMRSVLFHQAIQQRERTIAKHRGSRFRRAGFRRLLASVYRYVGGCGAGLVIVTHAPHNWPQNTSTSATRAPWLILRSPIHNLSRLIWLTAPYFFARFFLWLQKGQQRGNTDREEKRERK